MKFAVIIKTYRRKDGKTPFLLKRSIDSVMNQTHKDFKLFIIGDKYENDKEILKIIPKNAYYENLPIAYERDKYTGLRLWCCGGNKCNIHAHKKALAEGFDYICVLDHDEWWGKNHLSLFNENIPFAWACTSCATLPRIKTDKKIIRFLPKPGGVIGSSVCRNLKLLPLLPRICYEEIGKDIPGMLIYGQGLPHT